MKILIGDFYKTFHVVKNKYDPTPYTNNEYQYGVFSPLEATKYETVEEAIESIREQYAGEIPEGICVETFYTKQVQKLVF